MAERFDPRAFIAAERVATARTIATVETPPETVDAFALPSERAEFRRFQADKVASYRTIEGIEGEPALDRPWSPGLAVLRALPQPAWMKASKWDRLLYICLRFDRQWGAAAVANGWSELDLYGCHPSPWARHGIWLNGLAATILGLGGTIKVTGVTDDVITLQPVIEAGLNVSVPPASAPLSFRRHVGDRPGQSLIWHAYGHEAGP